jgi:uncharacterized protein (TIGR03382 family)
MYRSSAALLLGTSLSLAGCLDAQTDLGDSQQPMLLDIVGTPADVGEKPRGLYMVIPPEHATAPDDLQATESIANAGTIIYMNKDGGTYTPGFNNSSTNRSSIPQQTSTVPPWNVSDAGWQQVMDCVRDQFAPFDVEVTDIDPGQVPHFESVVAGRPQDVQLPDGVGGVSPFTSDCSVIDRSIVFTFAEVFGNNYRVICEVVAQEVAHSFGLDHQYLCEDPMTYLTGCGQKSFKDINAQCGEFEPRVCACGQQTQNSYQMLSQRIGIGDAVAPSVSINSPADGAVVPPGFTVQVEASDDKGIARVELYIDGVLDQTLTTGPFTFTTPATLSEGTHIIETRAYDSKNVAEQSISVTVEEGASDPNDPNNPGDPNDPNNPGDPNNPRPADLVGTCSSGGMGGTGTLALLLFAGLAVARRRRA